MKKDEELKQLGYKFLGWENGWSDYPIEYLNCRKENHVMNDISYSNRGTNNTRYCDICKIWSKYDCGD